MNIEGYNRNKYYLSKLLKQSFSLIFIQEHWLPEYNACSVISSDFKDYQFLTTSSDSFISPEDVLKISGPTWHGTALGWHSSLQNKISKIPVVSTRFCGVRLEVNDQSILAYTAYLPTSGKDLEFLEEIDKFIYDIQQNATSSSSIIIGMDANVSGKSSDRRRKAFESLLQTFNLESIFGTNIHTFHHNNGISESQIDYILTNNKIWYPAMNKNAS